MLKIRSFIKDTGGDAIVEAAILFPIMIMIFAALVLLSMYLPQRAVLQESAQVAATAIAIERSDTWIAVNENAVFERKTDLPNVYVAAFRNAFYNRSVDEAKVEAIVRNHASKGFVSVSDGIDVEYDIINYVIYQEVTVTVTQTIPMRQFGLSFIGFPENMILTQEARAVIQDGDEFLRNIDIAKDLFIWLDEQLGISKNLKNALEKTHDVLGLFGF